MEFSTRVPIPKSAVQIGYDSRMMLFGSCFSENIGRYLLDNKFRVNINPFGILYNPQSIAVAVNRILDNQPFSETDLVYRNGMFHSFMHHGMFSGQTENECLSLISSRFSEAVAQISETDVFLITFGSAYVYRLRETGETVGNCHKFPSEMFSRSRLSVNDIITEWTQLIIRLLEMNSNAKFIFTVSPIRHWKDGAHENQLSKSILHLAIDALQKEFADSVGYFPAYEIMLDELRDYRFYADDMMHPSDMAISYIWERFSETYFSAETYKIVSEWQSIRRALNHRPLNQNGTEYKNFLQQTFANLEKFAASHITVDCSQEIEKTVHLLESLA